MFSKKSYLLILIFSAACLWGQEISFEAKASKTEVSVNERFSIQFSVTYGQSNVRIDKPLDLPDFGGLHQLGESTQSRMSIQNGTVFNQSGIEVVLVAEQEGEYKIGSATVTLNGKKYRTKPITISVKKGLKPKTQPGRRLQGAFLSAEVNESNPFVNQEVILTVKLYARDYSYLNRIRNYEQPDFGDFIAKQVSEKPIDEFKQELVNGHTYVSQELARYILYPQKTGNLTIDPFELGIIVSSYYGSEVVPLTSEPVSLKVKSLPDGKPENFSGAIGNYKLAASLSKNKINANKAVNLEVEIIGSGNLNTLKTPSVEIPENIETYAPKRKDVFEARPSGLKGKVVEDHLLVPQYGGEYQIGPVVFNYFDPNKQKYISLKTNSLMLTVDGPAPPAPAEKDSAAQKNLNDHQRNDSLSQNTIVLPQKINEVKNQVVETVSENNNWIWLAIGALVLVIGIFIIFKRKNKNSNTNQNDFSQFKSLINNKLTELKTLSNSGNQTAFYSLQEEILTLIGMRFSQTNLSEFRENEVAEKLEKKVNSDLASRWKSIFLENKQAKYARFESQKNLSSLYSETKILVDQFFKF